MPSIVDRARFKVYLWRLDYHLNDLRHSRIREIRSEIRANTASAAADVGMRRALANLGHPRVLAAGYLSAEGRPLPTYRRGIYWAIAAFWAYNWTVMSYTLGFADGGAEWTIPGRSPRRSWALRSRPTAPPGTHSSGR